jgi:hypothetical protein
MAKKQQENEWPKGVSNPARRALEAAGYRRLEQLAGANEKELLALHGMGPKAMGVLKSALAERGLSFAKETATKP